MKYFIPISIAIFAFVGCKEIPPAIDFSSKKEAGDTTFVQTNVPQAQPKAVYVEEFTGVQCANCPNGHAAIKGFEAQYGERVVPVAIHSGELSDPFSDSQQDFRTAAGDNIQTNIYNEVAAWPCVGLDRRIFQGRTKREITSINAWGGLIGYQSRQANPCNLTLTSRFDAAANKIKVKATVEFTKDVAASHKISIMLTESGMIERQLLPAGGSDYNYVHKHVLRKMMTSWDGLLLPDVAVRGRVFVRNFELVPMPNWKLDSCRIVGFVHEAADSLRVQQAASVRLR
jgi:hypothetical protein